LTWGNSSVNSGERSCVCRLWHPLAAGFAEGDAHDDALNELPGLWISCAGAMGLLRRMKGFSCVLNAREPLSEAKTALDPQEVVFLRYLFPENDPSDCDFGLCCRKDNAL
jgi:hypothetical protein